MKINSKEINNNIKMSFNELKHAKTFYKQIPNLLTCSRALAPFVTIPLVLTGNIIPALICMGIFASTDFFDGLIARKFKITSELGRELDGVCDKIFALGLSVPLVFLNPAYLLNILLEGIIGATNLKSRLKGNKPKTIFVGKIKTFFLSFNIILGYFMMINGFNPLLFASIFLPTVGIQYITCSKYILINNNIKEENIGKTITNQEIQSSKNEIEKQKNKTLNYQIPYSKTIDREKRLVKKNDFK